MSSASLGPAVIDTHGPRPQRSRMASPSAAVAGFHVTGCAMFAVAMAWSDSAALTLAAGMTAYLLGVRHAFDADHIVAIDNTTRYLRARRRPAGSVGFWFSLGHSAVVFVACVLLGVGWQSLAAHVAGTESTGATAVEIWGPAVSGTFLVALAAINARIVVGLWCSRNEAGSDELGARGFVTRLTRRWTISRPSQMVAVGFLFGLGFDTATSVGLLLLTAGAHQATLSWSAFVALPLLFAAGMTLFDSANGAAMNRAYGWADSDKRRFHYNLAITGVSVAAAATVGAFTLTSLIGHNF